MQIGEAAARSGVSAKMIRHYEARGLFPAAARAPNGYRDYGDEEVAGLAFLRRARALGFSLDEAGALLDLWRDPGRVSREVKVLAQRQAAALRRRIAEMEAMTATLEALAQACHGDDRPDCPILADLADSAVAGGFTAP